MATKSIRTGSFLFTALLLMVMAVPAMGQKKDKCWSCHASVSPGIVEQWKNSQHFEFDVNCLACHQAESTDVDAFEHYGEKIAIIVSPKDCSVWSPVPRFSGEDWR